jgi:MFS family permease
MSFDPMVALDARGRRAPGMVAGVATTVLAVVLGVFGSIGVLIDPLAAEFDAPGTQLVLLFTAALSVHSLAARAAGWAMDRWGPRPLLATAAAGMAFGLLAPATAPTVWMAVGGYGLGLGLASASTWVATTAAVSAAFARRRSAALGLLTAGPAVGGVVLAPVMAALTEARGPRFTCAVLAALGVLTCAAGAVLLGPGRGAPRPAAGDTAVRMPEPGLRGFYAASLLMSLVVFVPLVHIIGDAVDLGLSRAQGAALFAVVSAVSAAARLGTGWLATPQTLPLLYRACHVLVAAAFVMWALTRGAAAAPMLLAVAVLFGAGYGAWLSLGPAVLASTCAPRRLGRAVGTLASVVGIGGVIGPVLAAPLLATAPAALLAGCAVTALAAAAALRRWDSPQTAP